ncbi:MAG: dihydroorotate dehydrogenase [Candidatus Latescibacterota bacterium]|nr:dihydroorotate dehydrogenase [Candidatus Latescibacterota bacterium]
MTDLTTNFAGIELRNPVLLASGTCGYGEELAPFLDLARLGGIVTKTITPQPRVGNAPPRIVETAAGMLNSIGLQNPGLDGFVQDKWPYLARLQTEIIVNIAAPTADLHRDMSARLEDVEGIAAIEVNISSPNMKDGGMLFGCSPTASREVIAAVRSATRRPVIAKLTPNVTDIVAIAHAVVDGGADGISMINTLLGMAVDWRSRKPVLGNVTGGLSGPAIKPVALALLWKVRQAVDVPIMGMGGIATAEDALEFLVAGATAVQVGTSTFVEPGAAANIVAGIESHCDNAGIARVEELVGTLRV